MIQEEMIREEEVLKFCPQCDDNKLIDPIEINNDVCFICLEKEVEGKKTRSEGKMETRKVKASTKLKAGKYKGKIVGKVTRDVTVKKTGKTATYVDYLVKVDGTDIELKFGFPDYISVDSAFGEFLAKVGGQQVTAESDVDIDSPIGKNITFMVATKSQVNPETEEVREFANIARETVKLDVQQ